MRRRCVLAASLVTAALALSGCHKKVVALLPPTPPPEMISVPPPGHPFDPEPEMPLEEAEALTVLLPRSPVFRYRPPPVAQVLLTPAPEPPMALGNLTTGDGASLRQETEDLVRAQERRLVTTPTAIAALHSQQVEQARLFLRQSDEALQKADLDGARTLATKARVLLDEISQ